MFFDLSTLTVSAQETLVSCFFIKSSEWLKHLCPIWCLMLLPATSTDLIWLCLAEKHWPWCSFSYIFLPLCSHIVLYNDLIFFLTYSYCNSTSDLLRNCFSSLSAISFVSTPTSAGAHTQTLANFHDGVLSQYWSSWLELGCYWTWINKYSDWTECLLNWYIYYSLLFFSFARKFQRPFCQN